MVRLPSLAGAGMVNVQSAFRVTVCTFPSDSERVLLVPEFPKSTCLFARSTMSPMETL